jgi:hypothetical protein
MLSRAVDRAFVGMTVKRPAYSARKVTGLFLLPLTFAVDVATFPIQAILVVILGDNFPFKEEATLSNTVALNENARFQQLTPEQQATARLELDALMRSGQVSPSTALALTEDGHWVLVAVDFEARHQLLARAAAFEQGVGMCQVEAR